MVDMLKEVDMKSFVWWTFVVLLYVSIIIFFFWLWGDQYDSIMDYIKRLGTDRISMFIVSLMFSTVIGASIGSEKALYLVMFNLSVVGLFALTGFMTMYGSDMTVRMGLQTVMQQSENVQESGTKLLEDTKQNLSLAVSDKNSPLFGDKIESVRLVNNGEGVEATVVSRMNFGVSLVIPVFPTSKSSKS